LRPFSPNLKSSPAALGAVVAGVLASLVVALPSAAQAARSRADSSRLIAGNLLVSTSKYREADIQPGVTVLPPGCTSGCTTATADGAYPYVFNNDVIDPSFGVAAPIVLDQVSPQGNLLSKVKIPTDQLVTSFSSKSELALNLSTSGREITFMGYVAPKDGLDISNSKTPAAPDPTNPRPGSRGPVSADPRSWA
jgi:hypothetical protein